MLRSLAAIVGGFLAYALLMGITMLALGLLMPAAFSSLAPREGWSMGAELAYSMIYAAFGGYVCALIARRDEVTHAGMLAVIILAMGVVNILASPGGSRPIGFEAAMLILATVATVLGGLLRARHMHPAIL